MNITSQETNRATVRRIFVVGCPRSGTTLLQSFLAAHPDLCSVPESRVFSLIRERSEQPNTFAAANYQAFRSHMARLPDGHSFPEGKLTDDELATSFLACMDEYALAQGRAGWIEKTPDHLFSVDTIQRYAPDACFVHILWQPIPTIASLLEAAWRHPEVWGGAKTIGWAADKWSAAIQASTKWAAHSNHFVACYESLCREPAQVLQSLCGFLGIPATDAMLDGQTVSPGLVTQGEAWKVHNADKVTHGGDAKARRLLQCHERSLAQSLIARPSSRAHRGLRPYRRRWSEPTAQAFRLVSRRLRLSVDQALTQRARRRVPNI